MYLYFSELSYIRQIYHKNWTINMLSIIGGVDPQAASNLFD